MKKAADTTPPRYWSRCRSVKPNVLAASDSCTAASGLRHAFGSADALQGSAVGSAAKDHAEGAHGGTDRLAGYAVRGAHVWGEEVLVGKEERGGDGKDGDRVPPPPLLLVCTR